MYYSDCAQTVCDKTVTVCAQTVSDNRSQANNVI